jgi:glyoxylase-like metal-dependent hydrolase (beta-lactamase superfamily II)
MNAPGKIIDDGLEYPFRAAPAPGETMEVAPGVLWVRMPLPYALDHINLWLLADGDGWCMVDTGIGTAATRDLWERIFASALGGRPVTRLIVTHHHPDHVGQSAWLTRRWGVALHMTETEWYMGRALALDMTEESNRWMVEFYRRAGCNAEALSAFATEGNSYGPMVEIAGSYRRIMGGDEIPIGGQAWRVMIGRGHAPEQACLYAPGLGVVIGGDQLLPRITPNVSVWPEEPDGNPLPQYLDSLAPFRELPERTLVLPSHKLPYRGLRRRIDALIAHHNERLAVARAAVAKPATVQHAVDAMFRPGLDRHQLMFAVGEAMAHLHHLMALGQVERTTRDDGLWIYRAR